MSASETTRQSQPALALRAGQRWLRRDALALLILLIATLLGQSPFVDPRSNYPDDLVLTSNEIPYPLIFAVAPIALALGPVLAYNVALLLCHLLTGYTAYRWSLRVAASRGAAIIAGLATALAGLIVIELLPGVLPVTRVAPRPADSWLAAQPGDFAVAFMPPVRFGNDVANARTLYGPLIHGKQVTAFAHPFHRSQAYDDFAARADGFPAPMPWSGCALGLRYVVLIHADYNRVDGPLWPAVAAALPAAPGLRVVAELEGATVVGFR